jgi:hypothetical protein
MAENRIPDGDPEFDTFMQTHVPYIVSNVVAMGLTGAQGTALNSDLGGWTSAFGAHNTAQATAQAATETKDGARDVLETRFRQYAGVIQANPAVTNTQRESAGVTVVDTIRTPTPEITTRPILMVDTSQRLRHTIKWADESTPTSRARPAAALGLELYRKIGGTAPVSVEGCEALGLITNSPNVEEYDAAHANQTVYYLGRWMNKRNQRGPLSLVISATVPG